MTLREEVYKALEVARAAKLIGTGLEARVVLDGPEDVIGFLRSFGAGLRFLFITSGVAFGPAGENAFRSETVPGFAVGVERAGGAKCERCWHFTADIGGDADWPSVCARCAGHIRELAST